VVVLCRAGVEPPAALLDALDARGESHVCVHDGPRVMSLLSDDPVQVIIVVEPQTFADCEALAAAVAAHYPPVRIAGLSETGYNGHESGVFFDLRPVAKRGAADAESMEIEHGAMADVEEQSAAQDGAESDEMHREIHQSIIRELHGDVQGGASSPWLSAEELAMLLGGDEDEVDATVDR
jgi:hypothetical protein